MANADNENLRVRQPISQPLARDLSFLGHFVFGRLNINGNELIHRISFKIVPQFRFVYLRASSTNLVA
jgi:hypothetical protein